MPSFLSITLLLTCFCAIIVAQFPPMPGCSPDESYNSIANAKPTELTPRVASNYSSILCISTLEIFYNFTLPASGSFIAQLSFVDFGFNVDIELLNNDGQSVSSSTGLDVTEQLTSSLTAGAYTFRVFVESNGGVPPDDSMMVPFELSLLADFAAPTSTPTPTTPTNITPSPGLTPTTITSDPTTMATTASATTTVSTTTAAPTPVPRFICDADPVPMTNNTAYERALDGKPHGAQKFVLSFCDRGAMPNLSYFFRFDDDFLWNDDETDSLQYITVTMTQRGDPTPQPELENRVVPPFMIFATEVRTFGDWYRRFDSNASTEYGINSITVDVIDRSYWKGRWMSSPYEYTIIEVQRTNSSWQLDMEISFDWSMSPSLMPGLALIAAIIAYLFM